MLPYSKDIYFILHLELHSGWSHWLAASLWLLLSIRLFRGAFNEKNSGISCACLSMLWILNGLVWHGSLLAPIHFMGPYYAALALIQAAVCIGVGVTSYRSPNKSASNATHYANRGKKTACFCLLAGLAFPLLDVLQGANWPAVRQPFLATEPLILVTIAVASRLKCISLLGIGCFMVVPLAFVGIQAHRAYALGLWGDAVPISISLVACCIVHRSFIHHEAQTHERTGK